MRNKLLIAVLSLFFILSAAGCYTQTFVVGSGAQGTERLEARQWYVLWGLVPINEVDHKILAGTAENYTIKTQHTPVDVLIGIFTGIITITPKTVMVTK